MKKILFLFLFTPIILNAQTKRWSDTLCSGNIYPVFGQVCGYPPYADTITWYWNRDEVKAYVASHSGGTVTSVTAGSGLSGGTITTSGTISLNIPSGISPAMSIDTTSVACTQCTTSSIIGYGLQTGNTNGGGQAPTLTSILRFNGSFKIINPSRDGSLDGSTFWWALIKP